MLKWLHHPHKITLYGWGKKPVCVMEPDFLVRRPDAKCHGGWRDASYSVHHATAETPTGPWRYRGCILKSDARHKGPGHHSILRLPGTDQWRIIYHRWNDRQGDGPFSGSREIAIDRLEHTPDGGITPIRMTDGETSRPQ